MSRWLSRHPDDQVPATKDSTTPRAALTARRHSRGRARLRWHASVARTARGCQYLEEASADGLPFRLVETTPEG